MSVIIAHYRTVHAINALNALNTAETDASSAGDQSWRRCWDLNRSVNVDLHVWMYGAATPIRRMSLVSQISLRLLYIGA